MVERAILGGTRVSEGGEIGRELVVVEMDKEGRPRFVLGSFN